MEISESSAEFKETLEEYETWVRDTMEPTILFKECRPYNPTSGKYYVFNNDDITYDPFGYYSGAPIGGGQKGKIGHSRDNSHQSQYTRGNDQGTRIVKQLIDNLPTHVLLRG